MKNNKKEQMKSLFFLLLLVFLTLGCKNEDRKLKDEIKKNVEFVISNIQHSTFGEWFLVESTLEKRGLAKEYRSDILSLIKEIHSRSLELSDEKLKNKIECKDIITKMNEAYYKINSKYKSILESTLDLTKFNEDDLKIKISKFSDKIYLIKNENKVCQNGESSSEFINSELIRMNSSMNFLIRELYMLFGSRGRRFQVFPIVIPDKKKYKRGELFKADIFLGNFVTSSKEELVIEINGKEYNFNNTKIEYSEKVPASGRKQTLRVVYGRRNMLTNEIERENAVLFDYEIE